jgi:hypothetical protein
LPILTTEGDVASEWVRQNKIGQVVPANDVNAVSNALSALLDMPKDNWSGPFKSLQEELRWSRIVEPLRRYCLDPKPAADHIYRSRTKSGIIDADTHTWRLARARYILRKEGFISLLKKSWQYLKNSLT